MSHTRIERRRWPRIPTSLLRDLSATIASTPDAQLVDLSRGGALFEVAGRCAVGTSLRVKLERPGGEPIVAAATVVRGNVISITDGRIKYRVAVAFEEAIPELASMKDIDQQQPTAAALVSGGSNTETGAPAEEASSVANLPLPAPARVDHVQRLLDERTAELQSVSSLLESLTEKLRTCAGFRAALHEQLETERRQREDERSTHVCQLTDAIARAEALQATLDAQQQQHSEALRERDARHESIVAELIKTSNEQQQEYHRLLDQSLAAEDEQRRRAEQYEQELAQRDVQLQEERAASEARCRELDARLEAAEMLRAAYDRRYKALQRQTEKLMMMFSASADSDDHLRDEPAPEQEAHFVEGVR